MTQKAIVKTRVLVLSALAAALPVLLSACQTSDPRDTTFVWNLATDPPDQSRPAHGPADRGPAYTPSEQGPAYAPSGHVDVRPLDQPPGASQKRTAPGWYQQSSIRDDRAT